MQQWQNASEAKSEVEMLREIILLDMSSLCGRIWKSVKKGCEEFLCFLVMLEIYYIKIKKYIKQTKTRLENSKMYFNFFN